MIRRIRGSSVRFIDKRVWLLTLALVLIISSVILLVSRGINYGIDFTGGALLEIDVVSGVSEYNIRERLDKELDVDYSIQGIRDDKFKNLYALRVQLEDEEGALDLVERVRGSLEGLVSEYLRSEYVGGVIGKELRSTALWSILMALGAILVYIWLRFDLLLATVGIVSLLHDCVVTLGFVSLIGMEFNIGSVAAILTICGYSINDSVVVLDRIRENRKKMKLSSWDKIIELGLNQVLVRSLITSVTTVLALVPLLIFGRGGIVGFSSIVAFGIVIGTYSSLCIGPQLLSYALRGKVVREDE